jgi:hypothetical protein
MTENLEYLHKLAREAEQKADELRGIINRIADVPVRGTRGGTTVYSELIRSKYLPEGSGDYGNGTAWSACTRIIEQCRESESLLGRLQCELEVLTSIADDLIGKTGRLV